MTYSKAPDVACGESSRTLRAIFVAPNISYLNPSGALLQSVAQLAFATDFFGPGFSSTEELERGLLRYIDEQGPFDLAITTEMIAGHSLDDRTYIGSMQWLTKYAYCNFPKEQLPHVMSIARDWQHVNIPRFVSLIQADYYHWTIEQCEIFLRNSDVLLAPDVEHPLHLASLSSRDAEERLWSDPTDAYARMIDSAARRVVSFPHFVSSTEFSRTALALRPKRWAVPGVEYRERRIAKSLLKTRGHRFQKRTVGQWVYKFGERRGKVPRYGIDVAQSLFRRQLTQAQAAFTCGSILGVTIRKYFEIPAAGALLACQPSRCLSEYGFVDGLNCYFVDGADILEVDDFIQTNPDAAQAIARRGQEHVMRQHSVEARALQLRAICDAYLEGRFAGALFSQGSFQVLKQGP